MAEVKKVKIYRSGGTASADDVEIIPGETADQLCVLVAPKLGLPADGSYRLLGPDRKQISGDVYKAVKDGDELIIEHPETGG
jgi:hypothetical protein